MADQELSPMQQAVAQQAAKTAIQRWKAEAKEVLTQNNNAVYLVAEDLGGAIVGGGTDLATRWLFFKYMKRQKDDEGNQESEENYHKRWDRWTGGLSMVMGTATLAGAYVMSHGEMSIHPLKQGMRTSGVAQLLLGGNRLISSALKLPA